MHVVPTKAIVLVFVKQAGDVRERVLHFEGRLAFDTLLLAHLHPNFITALQFYAVLARLGV